MKECYMLRNRKRKNYGSFKILPKKNEEKEIDPISSYNDR